MKFHNYELDKFSEVIFNIKLKGKESRMRTRLLKQISEYLEKTIQIEKDEILKEYALKDDKGEMIFSEDGTQIKINPDRIGEFNTEYNNLMNETYSIDETDSNEEIIKTVGNSLINCDLEFQGQEAHFFDSWCERFEEAIARYETKEESQ